MAVVSLQMTEVRMKVTKLQRSMEDLNFNINQIKCYMTKIIRESKEKAKERGGEGRGGKEKEREKGTTETFTLPLNKAIV